MRSLITLAVMANLVGVSVHAQETTETTTLGTATQTETAKAGDVAPVAAIPKKFALVFDSESNKAMTNDNQAYSGDIETYQALKLGYKFQSTLSGQVVSEWTHRAGYGTAAGGVDNETKSTFEDISLRLTKSNIIKTGPVGWTLQGRYYIPVSDSSKAMSQVGQIRAYLIGGMDITKKLSAELLISPRYYIQKNKSFVDTNGDVGGDETKGATLNNNDWRILNSAALKYALTDALAVETTLGVYSKKKHNAEMKHFQDYSTSLYYTLNSNLSVNAGIRATDGALDIDNTGVELYTSHASEYFGLLTVSL